VTISKGDSPLPNTVRSGRRGFCRIFNRFSGLEFILLPSRAHTRPAAANANRKAAFQMSVLRKMEESHMESFHEYVSEYRAQLAKGAIQKAYRGLMAYIMALKSQFKDKYPDCFVSGNIYTGYMDMTYFSFFPESLKQRDLKVAIVFLHEPFRFEAWLAGYNKQVQARYWRLFRDSGWNQYHVVADTKGADSIVECLLADSPDFRNLDALTVQIETTALKFIQDVEGFLSSHEG
jgi:hypothetical protein